MPIPKIDHKKRKDEQNENDIARLRKRLTDVIQLNISDYSDPVELILLRTIERESNRILIPDFKLRTNKGYDYRKSLKWDENGKQIV